MSTDAGEHHLVIRNDSKTPFGYVGYDSAVPVYAVEVRKEEKWTKVSLGWCGTGIGPHTLGPKKTLISPIYPGETFPITVGQKFRVLLQAGPVEISDGVKGKPLPMIYSNELTYTGKKG